MLRYVTLSVTDSPIPWLGIRTTKWIMGAGLTDTHLQFGIEHLSPRNGNWQDRFRLDHSVRLRPMREET